MCLAIPGCLVAISGQGELRIGRVDFGGVSRDTSLVFVPEATVGDHVLVHVGFAIAVIDEDLARETLEALAMLDALAEPAPIADALAASVDAAPRNNHGQPRRIFGREDLEEGR